MDNWLTDGRAPKSYAGSGSRKGKNKEETVWSYPALEEGSLNAATLQEKDGRLDWTYVNKDLGRRLVSRGSAVEIFPRTRAQPLRMPHTSVQQRADQGAHFLRTYFPDVDIPAELIREEVAADAKVWEKLQAFDPYVGNLLEAVECHDGPRKKGLLLAFPMNESNRDLNISPFTFDARKHAVFKPLSSPIRSFDTPILQITSLTCSPDSSEPPKSYSVLAVRTFASTTMLEIKAKISGTGSRMISGLHTVDLWNANRSDAGNQQIADVKLRSSTDPQAIVINDQGVVYKSNIGGGRNALDMVYTDSANLDVHPEDHFWRLAVTDDSESYLLTSSSIVHQRDFRSRGSDLTMYATGDPGCLITSVEHVRSDHLVSIVTTREILWIDERFTRKPILGYKHQRDFDRTLEARTTTSLSSPLTLLTSRKNGYITVYDVSRDEGLVYSNALPYSVSTAGPSSSTYAGYAHFRHPLHKSINDLALVKLCNQGSLHRLDLQFVPDAAVYNVARQQGYEWTDEVKQLSLRADHLRPYTGPLGGREFSDVNLRPAYERLFGINSSQTAETGEENLESVYDTLEKMPFFKQDSDMSIDHTLTMFDIAFRSGDEPSQASRADFFTQSTLSSTRGYRALIQGRLPKEQLVRQVSWHRNITAFLQHFDPTIFEDPQETSESLRQYDLTSDFERAGPSFRRETEAREQLTLDLALSTDVFSVQPFLKPSGLSDDAFETMSRAAESMSLGDNEPPPVHFGYLRPLRKGATDHYAKHGDTDQSTDDDLETPIGVRLLLQEWEIGAEPNSYEYQDPYNAAAAGVKPTPSRAKVHPESQQRSSDTQVGSQRPPVVVAARSLMVPPPIITVENAQRRLAAARSYDVMDIGARGARDTDSQATMENSQSQGDYMTSTQILPGPFGGRRPMGKKKTVKKRKGGF